MKIVEETIIFGGGGTGGHFYPLIAVIRAFKKIAPHWRIYYVFPDKGISKEIHKEGIYGQRIISGKLRRYFSLHNLISPLKIFYGLGEAIIFIYKTKPKIVFLKGGYGSLPIGLAALIWHVPIVIHESDFELGLINKFFARWAKMILVSFKETKDRLPKNKEVFVVGNPVRKLDCQTTFNKERLREELGFRDDKQTLLILGGSQGASEINELIFNLLDKLTAHFQIIHSVGEKNFKSFKIKLRERFGSSQEIFRHYHFYPYLAEKDICQFYLLSDIIISRAGSGAIFEIARAGKPSILIPLQGAASDHQRKNAYAYLARRACLVIERPNLKKNLFLSRLMDLAQNSRKLKTMAQHAEEFACPESAQKIAASLLTLAKRVRH